MSGAPEVGRFLIVAGTVIVVLGLVLLLSDKIPIGRLPGDLRFGGGRFHVYVPVVTCILVSLALTLIINLFSRR